MTQSLQSHPQLAARLTEAQTLAERLGIQVEHTDLSDPEFPFKSGLCRIKGQEILILDRKLDIRQQMTFLLEALRKQDLENEYVPSWIRESIENPEYDPCAGL